LFAPSSIPIISGSVRLRASVRCSWAGSPLANCGLVAREHPPSWQRRTTLRRSRARLACRDACQGRNGLPGAVGSAAALVPERSTSRSRAALDCRVKNASTARSVGEARGHVAATPPADGDRSRVSRRRLRLCRAPESCQRAASRRRSLRLAQSSLGPDGRSPLQQHALEARCGADAHRRAGHQATTDGTTIVIRCPARAAGGAETVLI